MEDIDLIIETTNKTLCSLSIPKNALLLANNLQKVYRNQVIAEIKKDANLVLEEDRKNIYTEVSGEVFLQNINVKESIEIQKKSAKILKGRIKIWSDLVKTKPIYCDYLKNNIYKKVKK